MLHLKSLIAGSRFGKLPGLVFQAPTATVSGMHETPPDFSANREGSLLPWHRRVKSHNQIKHLLGGYHHYGALP